MPINTGQFHKLTESDIFDYYQKHSSINNRLLWTNQKLANFDKIIANQIKHDQYHREFQNDLIVINELKVLKQVLKIDKLFKTINCSVISGINTVKQPSSSNIEHTIELLINRFKLLDIDGSFILDSSFMMKLLNDIAHIDLLQSIRPLDVRIAILKFTIADINSPIKWRYSYKNMHELKMNQLFSQQSSIKNTSHIYNCYLNMSHVYKSDLLYSKHILINYVIHKLLKNQSFSIMKITLKLLFDLKLINPELLISYFVYYSDQCIRKYVATDSDTYYKFCIDFNCSFNNGKNHHYYHELILSKFLSKILHCDRRRPFSLNVYFKMLSLLPRYKKEEFYAN